MLPVFCAAAAPGCSSLCPVLIHPTVRNVAPSWRIPDDRSGMSDRHFVFMKHTDRWTDKFVSPHAAKSIHSFVAEEPGHLCSLDSSILSPYSSGSDDIVREFRNMSFNDELYDPCYSAENGSMIDSSGKLLRTVLSTSEDSIQFTNESLDQFTGDMTERIISDGSIPLTEGSSETEQSVSRFIDSVAKSVFKVEDALTETYDTYRRSAIDAIETAKKSVATSVDSLLSSIDLSKRMTTSETKTDILYSLQDKIAPVGDSAVEIFRSTIVSSKESLAKVASFVTYSYGSAKSALPPNFQDALSISEEKASLVLRPVGNLFQQFYFAVEGFEKNLGLDPSDPVVQFFVLLGGSAAIGASYWLYTYGGYSGDLEPEQTLASLKNDKNAVLIDIRPEELRERDGVPDLRREARAKYANVTLPELDGSTRKMLRGGREVDAAILSVIIRNIKLIKEDSKVIVMDVDGTHSKAIARSLKRLGVKRPYLVRGGFRSWTRSLLPAKELKPESALTILNEDAQAILAEIKPTPTLILGYAVGFSAAGYALLEWERTLQLIGIFSLGLTIYQRIASYEDSKDLRKDIWLLLSPVRMGAQAFSWAASRFELNRNGGLPTSPSTTAVHDRVVQAAAKHESQPSEVEEVREPPAQSNENLPSEA